MQLTNLDKRFLFSLLYAVGVIFLWRGIWGIADITPIIKNYFASLFIGLLILTVTGLIFREFNPLKGTSR